jgi:hypothetical protein
VVFVDLGDYDKTRDFSLRNVGTCVNYLLNKISHIAIRDFFLEIIDFELIKDIPLTPSEAQQRLSTLKIGKLKYSQPSVQDHPVPGFFSS